MAITFPASPSDGDVFTNTTTGVKYIYNSTDGVWKTHVWPTNTNYLQLSGGTLTGNLSLGTNDLTAQDITTTGSVTVGNGLTVSDGNVVMASGHGIDFSATDDTTVSGAASTSELFDDYEEGTWTPFYEPSTGAFTSVTYDPLTFGRYTKIGRLCHAWGFIRTDAITLGTAADSVFLSGFPFTAKFGTAQGCVGAITNVTAWSGEDPMSMRMDADSGVKALLYYRTSSSSFDVTSKVTDLGLGADDNRVYFTITYEVE